MERPYILHMLTPAAQVSPFDVNMAVDAGYQVVFPHCGVHADQVRGLTQDAIFSRGPKGALRTGLFIGGRDVELAADMADEARKAMFPPFQISILTDPSGAFTTAAALVAAIERHLRARGLTDRAVLVLGGTGPVGRIAAVLAAGEGAHVRIASSRGEGQAKRVADETGRRFGCSLHAAGSDTPESLRAALRDAEIVIAAAAAGARVLSAGDRRLAVKLEVAADINAVPPEGIEGVAAPDDGKPLDGGGVGIGALAIGNVKYKVEQSLLARMRSADKPVVLGYAEAFATAREIVSQST